MRDQQSTYFDFDMSRFRWDIQAGHHRHHWHQAYLESIIQFQSTTPLSASERIQARKKFRSIIDHFEPANPGLGDQPYNPVRLVQLTCEYARSDESRDVFLQAFFQTANIAIDDDAFDLSERDLEASVALAVSEFADFLVDSFFLPCMCPLALHLPVTDNGLLVRASTKQTPQPSPAIHSAIQRAQGGGVQDFVGTPGRLSELRGECLVRDGFRCVVSRQFDRKEFLRRYQQDGAAAVDDDGDLLQNEPSLTSLEVAHIMPHSLTQPEADGSLVCLHDARSSCHLLNHLISSILLKRQRLTYLTCSTTASFILSRAKISTSRAMRSLSAMTCMSSSASSRFFSSLSQTRLTRIVSTHFSRHLCYEIFCQLHERLLSRKTGP